MKEKTVNTGRQLEFDFAKVFAIFFMVLIHIYETVNGSSTGTLGSTNADLLVEFLGGPLAAPSSPSLCESAWFTPGTIPPEISPNMVASCSR